MKNENSEFFIKLVLEILHIQNEECNYFYPIRDKNPEFLINDFEGAFQHVKDVINRIFWANYLDEDLFICAISRLFCPRMFDLLNNFHIEISFLCPDLSILEHYKAIDILLHTIIKAHENNFIPKIKIEYLNMKDFKKA